MPSQPYLPRAVCDSLRHHKMSLISLLFDGRMALMTILQITFDTHFMAALLMEIFYGHIQLNIPYGGIVCIRYVSNLPVAHDIVAINAHSSMIGVLNFSKVENYINEILATCLAAREGERGRDKATRHTIFCSRVSCSNYDRKLNLLLRFDDKNDHTFCIMFS